MRGIGQLHQYKRQLDRAVPVVLLVLAALLALQIFVAPPAVPTAPGRAPTLLHGWRKAAFATTFFSFWWVMWAKAFVSWFPPGRSRGVAFWGQGVFFSIWTAAGVAAQAVAAWALLRLLLQR